MSNTKAELKKRSKALSEALDSEESYVNGHLTHTAFASIAILTFITFVGNFTQLQLSAALPTIVSEFHISVTTGQWLTSIFQLVMGVMVPLTAFLTRRFTTRQIVITSMAVFTVGSLLSWVGSSFIIILTGRLLEAIGTGVMWPVLQITVFSIYPLSRRGMAMGTVGMAMSVAPALGPTIGGLQTDMFGWRSIFFTLTAIGVFCLLLSIFGLRNFGATDQHAKADFFSVALSVFGFGGLMFGFTNIESYPPTHPMVWLATLIGILGIIWFVLRQIHHARSYAASQTSDTSDAADTSEASSTAAGSNADTHVSSSAHSPAHMRVQPHAHTHTSDQTRTQAHTRTRNAEPPLLDLGVLRNRSFTIGTICAALSFFAFSSIMVIMPLYIQNDRGYSATISGLVMMPGAFGMCISQYFGGKLLDRLGARPVAITGTAVLLFGTIMMSLINDNTWIWWVSIWQFIRQIGMGFIIMPITTWSLNCLESDKVSAGSAVTNTVRQIAGAIGAPVLVILMETLTQIHGGNPIAASIFGTQWTLRFSALLVFVQMLIVIFGVKGAGAGSSREAAQRALAKLRA